MRFRQAGNVSIADEREIVAYDVAAGGDWRELSQIVAKMIEDGWQPFGSLCAGQRTTVGFYQAVVKYKADESNGDD